MGAAFFRSVRNCKIWQRKGNIKHFYFDPHLIRTILNKNTYSTKARYEELYDVQSHSHRGQDTSNDLWL